MKQIVLSASECSGRGVRVELLSLEARAQVLQTAAMQVGPEATMLQLRVVEEEIGVAAMVVGVTTKTGFKSRKELVEAGEAAGWRALNAEVFEKEQKQLFNSKDMTALGKMFRKLHDVSDTEVDAMLGEALDVTAD